MAKTTTIGTLFLEKIRMKTVRANYSESSYGQFDSEVHDDWLGKRYISGWVIDDDYFVASEDCPKFDPRDGSPLNYIEDENDDDKRW